MNIISPSVHKSVLRGVFCNYIIVWKKKWSRFFKGGNTFGGNQLLVTFQALALKIWAVCHYANKNNSSELYLTRVWSMTQNMYISWSKMWAGFLRLKVTLVTGVSLSSHTWWRPFFCNIRLQSVYCFCSIEYSNSCRTKTIIDNTNNRSRWQPMLDI